MDYFGNVNPDLLSRIPLEASRVLEIGCGSGKLGFSYKLRNPNVHYVGVEADSHAASEAKKFLDKVHCGDAEDFGSFNFNAEKFDCIIYGDVLEHLKNPWECLMRYSDLLSASGELLICIPNVQHWSAFANLFQGLWPLEAQGLFDKTHLRWFTRKTILSMLKQIGLVVHEIKPRIFDAEKAKEFVSLLEPSLERMQINISEFLQDVSPLQYVIRAGKSVPEMLHVDGFCSIQPSSMADVRLGVPFAALQTKSSVRSRVFRRSNLQILPSDPSQNRVFVWQRPLLSPSQSTLDSIRTLLKNNYLYVIDFDDDPDHFQQFIDTNYFTFRDCHAVQVSTPEIAEFMKEINPEVRIFANNVMTLRPERSCEVPRGLRIFFGALNREQDWAPLMEVLNSSIREAPGFWSFSVIHDRAFYDSLEIPESQKSFLPLCDYPCYQQVMAECDVAFLPLRDNRFNRMKSDLKAVEAGSLGLAPLASDVVYRRNFVDGQTAALFSTPEQLQQVLHSWHENPESVRDMGRRAREYVGKFRLQCHQVSEREAWYRDLCVRRDELTQALYERVPEFADC